MSVKEKKKKKSKQLSKKLLRYGEGKSEAELTKMMLTACKCPRSRIIEALARRIDVNAVVYT